MLFAFLKNILEPDIQICKFPKLLKNFWFQKYDSFKSLKNSFSIQSTIKFFEDEKSKTVLGFAQEKFFGTESPSSGNLI